MISFWRIFWLETVAFARTKTLAMLLVASAAWMLLLPRFLRGDGTLDGARELYVHYSLGGVFTLLVIALLASATGSLAKEREAKRLQLTLIRPVRRFAIVLGKIVAHVAIAAIVLGVSVAILSFRVGLSRNCNHVLSPILPTPQEEARAMYAAYMNDPDTPDAVKRAKKGVVLRLLAQRAVDHYQTIATNATVAWRFPLPADGGADAFAVRLRFTNQLDMRQDVFGVFRLGGFEGVVSNITQAVVTLPLAGSQPTDELVFENRGANTLMLRPRCDINLLTPADAFGWNLLRTYLELVAILALIVSFGLLLSSGLGRSVAMFVAFVTLIVGEMSPSVVEQYPDELETKTVDRIGLCITRFVAEVTRPFSAASPLEALAKDECVEAHDVVRTVVYDIAFAPIFLAMLAAFLLPRKQEDVA